MIGSALVRLLKQQLNVTLLTTLRCDLELLDFAQISNWFEKYKPDQVYMAAAKVGGIYANNTRPAEFIFENLMVKNNIIHAAWQSGVRKLLSLDSSCIYPKFATQPISESELLMSELETTNEPYAIAKIAGIKMCESYSRQYGVDYRSVMSTNLYGPHDNFHPDNAHVIPAMMQRFHKVKINKESNVDVWGSGISMREFLHVDDLAAASVHVMQRPISEFAKVAPDPTYSHINIGTGIDCTIRELAETMAEVVGYKGAIWFNSNMPDGAPRKFLNVDRISDLVWSSTISLHQGLVSTYKWYGNNIDQVRVL